MLGELKLVLRSGECFYLNINGGKVTYRHEYDKPYQAKSFPEDKRMELLNQLHKMEDFVFDSIP